VGSLADKLRAKGLTPTGRIVEEHKPALQELPRKVSPPSELGELTATEPPVVINERRSADDFARAFEKPQEEPAFTVNVAGDIKEPVLPDAPTDHDSAIEQYRALLKKYGVIWTGNTAAEAYLRLKLCRQYITTGERTKIAKEMGFLSKPY